jgi:integral membrane sensor domain MASE1
MKEISQTKIFIFELFSLFLAYFLTAKLGLSLDAVSGFATLVWPPTGIGFAALLIFGYRLWPAVFLAAFLVNFSAGATTLTALAIGVGNTLAPLAAAYFFRKIVNFNNLERLRCALALILVSLTCMLISSTTGTTSLWLSGSVPVGTYFGTWWAWWIGDVLGILLVGSLLLINWKKIISSRPGYPTLIHFFTIELAVALASIAAFWVVFDYSSTLIFYLLFSPLIWAALKFGQSGGVAGVFTMTCIAIFGAVAGYGPFAGGEIGQNLLIVQLFMGLVAINMLILGAVVSEREAAQAELRGFNQNLEQRVIGRTNQLSESEKKYRLLSEDLEKRVEDRTKDLNEKIADLEKLNKFMVGREVRMIELKEVLKDQKIELDKLNKKKTVRKVNNKKSNG